MKNTNSKLHTLKTLAGVLMALTLLTSLNKAKADEIQPGLFRADCRKDAQLFWGSDGCSSAIRCAEERAILECYSAGHTKCTTVVKATVSSESTRPQNSIGIAWVMARGFCSKEVLVKGSSN